MTMAEQIRAGLIRRGMAPHVADAFILNFQDESGLNPGINERAPIVPGSRGGFGLAQWTGPRRRQLEDFARQRGVAVSDLDAQLDFLMMELHGPESRAASRIFSAGNTADAAVAIVEDFLRPLETHQRSRAARYAGAETTPSGNVLSFGSAVDGSPAASTNALGYSMGSSIPVGGFGFGYDMGVPLVDPLGLAPQTDDENERESPFQYSNRIDPEAFRVERRNVLAPAYRRYA